MTDQPERQESLKRAPQSTASASTATIASILVAVLVIATLRIACFPFKELDVAPSSVSVMVDLNRATAEELQLLPGVGAKLAADIIAHRGTLGTYASIEQLMEIRGIKQAKLDQLRPFLIPISSSDEP